MNNSEFLLRKCKKHFKLFLLYYMACNYDEQKSFIEMLDSFDFKFWGDKNV